MNILEKNNKIQSSRNPMRDTEKRINERRNINRRRNINEERKNRIFSKIDRKVKRDLNERVDPRFSKRVKIEETYKNKVSEILDKVVEHINDTVDPRLEAVSNHVEDTVDVFVSNIAEHITETIEPHIEKLVEHVNETVDPYLSTVADHINDTVDPYLSTITEHINKSLDPYVKTITDHINDTVDPTLSTIMEHINETIDPHLSTITKHINETIDPHLSTITKHINETVDPHLSTITKHINETIDPFVSTITTHINETLDPEVSTLKTKMEDMTEFMDETVIPMAETLGISNLPLTEHQKTLKGKLEEGNVLLSKVDDFLAMAQKQKTTSIMEERSEPYINFLTMENRAKFTMLDKETKAKIQERLVEVKPLSENEVLKVWENVVSPDTKLDNYRSDMKRHIPPMLLETFNSLPMEKQFEILDNSKYYNLSNAVQKEQYFFQQSILTEGMKMRQIDENITLANRVNEGKEQPMTEFQRQQRIIMENLKLKNNNF